MFEPDGHNDSLGTQESQSPPPISEIAALKMRPFAFALLSLAGIFFLYQVVGGGLTLLIFGEAVTKENVEWMRLSTMLAQILFLLFPTLVLMKMQHGTFSSVVPRRIPRPSEVVLALAGVFSLEQVMEGYLFFQDKIPLPESLRPFIEQIRRMIEETYRLLVQAHSVPELFFVILVVALTPAICEELLFRGLIQKNITLATSKKSGYILAGIIFGLYHVNPFLIVPLIALGTFFGFLMYRSETILVPMLAHFTNNVISILGTYYEGDVKDPDTLSMFNSLSEYSSTFVISTMVGFAIIFLISMYFYFQTTSGLHSSENAVSRT
jgi:membrane protease YdiL (CAAX protease family)